LRDLPAEARIVIVGGGVAGASIAYHLAQLGEPSLLVDRNQLTSGSTFHSAGLVGQLRGSVSLTRMMMHSVELYRTLDCGWVECGGLRLACSPERLDETRRQAGWAQTFDLPLELISPAEAVERFPLMSDDGVLAASWLPTDGYLDPSLLTYALADGARAGGCDIHTNTRVTGIEVRDGRVRGIETDRGSVAAELVVLACGMYTPEVAALAGVHVPIVPMAHEYLVTQPFQERRGLPTLRDPDHLVYFREEGGGLVMGGYERESAPWGLDGIPPDFNGILLEEDWDRFEPLTVAARMRVPAMDQITVTRLINGPEAFTPDNEFCLGESEVGGLFVAAGFCAHGLAGAGGIGKVMAEWIAAGEPQLDLWQMDIRRFGAHYRSPQYTLARTKEVYETYYDIKPPHHERSAGRPLRMSPVYAWHAEHGAVFGEKAGWERVNWYEPTGIAEEHRACRETAALFDETSFAKLEVTGDLQPLCNRTLGPVGTIKYTQMPNARGGIECDVTVTRLAEDRYRVITGTAFGGHDRAWLEKHGLEVRDVTFEYACFGLWGPRARDILPALDFPFMHWREVTVGSVGVLAARVTFVGEHGWELYCPMERGLELWEWLWEAGQPHGLVAGGYRAIDSLRLEKGYRVWGADITPDVTPAEAGLAKGDPPRRLRCLVLEDPRRIAFGNEPVRAGDEVVGRTTSGGYGYTVERSIAYALLPAAVDGDLAVGLSGEWVPARIEREPLYDPDNARVRS
jgi:4-methylaminobutanoate oxidase (formaldehyde-forming)